MNRSERQPITYSFLSLPEVGEFSDKIAKAVRKEQVIINENDLCSAGIEDSDYKKLLSECKKEAGDILWQLSGLCNVMGWSLDEVATENLAKLQDRKKRNVIVGNGDNR